MSGDINSLEQILDMIENLGNSRKLDLSRRKIFISDFSGGTIRRKKAERWNRAGIPPWFSEDTKGILLQGVNFQGCDLEDCDFSFADLRGADLSETKLERVEFSEANLQGVWLRGARLDRTQLQWWNIKIVGEESERLYDFAKEVYRDLKINFKTLGYYDDARWAYLKERAMERKSHPWHSPFWFLSWTENIFTGYMERIWVIILWLAIWPLLFAFLYGQLGGVTNILGNPPPPISPHDYLFFSLRTMVTLAYSDFTPVGTGQWLAPLEGALGIAFFALLAFSVAKRIARD